jgi:hypothetical protein
VELGQDFPPNLEQRKRSPMDVFGDSRLSLVAANVIERITRRPFDRASLHM